MSFVLLSLVRIIYLMFGYDVNKIKRLSESELNQIFEKNSLIYLIFKNLSYFFMFFCSIAFFTIYALINNNPNFNIPMFSENKILFNIPLSKSFAPVSYIWLIFGLLYLVFSIKIFKEYIDKSQHPNKNTKKNIASFFDVSYWSCIIIIMVIKLILDFTVDGIQYAMEPSHFNIMTTANNGNNSWMVFTALYYIVTIFTISLIILSLVMFVHHPKLKLEYKNQLKLAANQIKSK